LAYGDLLNDGSLDIVINNLNSTPNLLVNRGQKGNSITVKLVGTTSNRDAIGARVEVKAGTLDQVAEVRSGCCYLSQSDMRLHFVLGNTQEVDAIKVRWPSGQTETFAVKGINRIVEIKEGTGG
jgi:hypothetical protein